MGEEQVEAPGEELLLEYTEGDTSRVAKRQGDEASKGEGTCGMRDGDNLGDPPGVTREQHEEEGDKNVDGVERRDV